MKIFYSPWVLSVLCGFIFTFLLLYVMCVTVERVPQKREYPVYTTTIDVVNIKKRPNRLHPKRRKIEKIKKRPRTIKVNMNLNPEQIKKFTPSLPFKINLRLPVSVGINVPTKFSISPPPPLKDIFSPKDLDTPLMPLVKIPPIYPIRARSLGVEGWVKVRFLVDEKGEVKDIRILKSKPRGFFEKSTIEAISRWKFNPPILDGSPVKVIVETTIKYKLEK